jgi:hypothetical protein
MKVRHKFFATLMAGMVVAGIGIQLASSGTLVNNFSALDKTKAKDDLERIEAVFGQIVSSVHAQTAQLAEGYEQQTPSEEALMKLDLDGTLLTDQRGGASNWV